jgi:ribosomal protein S18 acetylase RimI-like enzyme
MDYSYIRIDPHSTTLPKLAQQYKALRLSGLAQSPGSFSSTYAIESLFPDNVWTSRLQLPGRETFICVARTLGASEDQGEFVAQVTLLGPIPASSFRLPEESQQGPTAPDDEEEKWQMLSLYTLPTHQGKGIGKMLCREAFQWLKKKKANVEEQTAKKVCVRIMVRAENTAALKLYEKLGFVDAGRCTLAEALRANGDADMVPRDGGDQKYNTRSGLIMTLSFER